ncbi:hypothetical protein CFOL_v3_02218 [Cephalotus follicularis]|uniref:Exo_endo_phos domain-containing protein n=1 Tax=Cephalotus follicularis TaxID=3775 RepID=A0A1Q3ASN6_CEPFO|nr:hypothetical protein CFOL_v3_02218 [Cephalotus follicularis]
MRSVRQIDEFRQTLNDCMLRYLGYRSCPFTWCNGRTDMERIRCHLDKCTGTTEWLSLFPHAMVTHKVLGVSDHSPMRLSLLRRQELMHKRRKMTRFEAMWAKDMRWEEIIKVAWTGRNQRTDVLRVLPKLRQCREDLANWSKETIGNLKQRIMEKKLQIKDMVDDGVVDDLKSTYRELNDLIEKEELSWYQRPRVDWLRDGDKTLSSFTRRDHNKDTEIESGASKMKTVYGGMRKVSTCQLLPTTFSPCTLHLSRRN